MFQAKALANAVFAYASNIDDLGKLTDAIGIIAQKHVSFQVPPNSYQDVGTELLKSIKEILGKVMNLGSNTFGNPLIQNVVGLYRTSRPVRKSGKFSKSGLSGNRTFSFPDAGL